MMRSASILGGSWINGENAGSRYANLDNWPDNSNENLGARGRSDDPFLRGDGQGLAGPSAMDAKRRCATRPGGQPARPASANTLQGPVKRGVVLSLSKDRNPRPASI